MKTSWLVMAVTVVGAMSACSRVESRAPGQAATAAVKRATPIADPCRLLTQAEASAAIGATLAPGETRRFGTVTRCSFFNRADPQQEVLLDVRNETAPVADPVLFDSYTHLPDVKPISGIGDQALWVHSQIGTGIDILKSGRLVEVKLPRTLTAMTPAVEKAAKLIASRM